MPHMVAVFGAPEDVSPFNLDGKVYRFPFSLLEAQYISTPRQSSQTTHGRITVQASGTLLAVWGVSDGGMVKALFEVAREHLRAILTKAGQIAGDISLVIETHTQPGPCPYDIDHIPEPQGAVMEFHVSRPVGFL